MITSPSSGLWAAIDMLDAGSVHRSLSDGHYPKVHLHGMLRHALVKHVWSSELDKILQMLLLHGACPFFDPFQGRGGPCAFRIAVNTHNKDVVRLFTRHWVLQSQTPLMSSMMQTLFDEDDKHDQIDLVMNEIAMWKHNVDAPIVEEVFQEIMNYKHRTGWWRNMDMMLNFGSLRI
jgi:hypothetical protein